MGAYILDAILVGLLTSLFGGYFLWRALRPWVEDFTQALSQNDTTALENLSTNLNQYLTGRDFLIFSVISVLVGTLYHVGFLTRFGATPGKMALRISVRERDRPGPPSAAVAMRRYALTFILGIFSALPGGLAFFGSILGLLDVLWPLWDGKRQALHDKIAGTNVVQGKAAPRQAKQASSTDHQHPLR